METEEPAMTRRTLLRYSLGNRGRRAALVATLAASLTAAAVSPATVAARTLPRPGATAPAGPAILLINGDRAVLGSAAGGRTTSIVRPPGLPGLAGELSVLRTSQDTFLFPRAALPYLGRGLDLSLFEASALRHAEHGGRLPVTLRYQGRPRAVPGVTITHRGAGAAQGYLTASSAPAFGAALARQLLADHARGSYGRDGLFAGGLSIGLTGTAITPRAPVTPRSPTAPGTPGGPHRAGFPLHTLTMRGINQAGHPDTGDEVFVANVTEPLKFSDPVETTSFFYHGTAKFSVPDGTYWAFGDFIGPGGSERLDVLPQFTVRGNATVTTSSRAATSKTTFVTPRPSRGAGALMFLMIRGSAAGYNEWIFFGGDSLWINQVSRPPAAGYLDVATSTAVISPAGAGTPYVYALDFPAPPGTIPSQHFVVRPADLATVHERYYQDPAQEGGWLSFGGTAAQARTLGIAGMSTQVRLPGRQTLYLTAHPAMIWQTSYFINGISSGQTNPFRRYHGGQDRSETWNAYPLHPAPNVVLPGTSFFTGPVLPSASRARNTLLLDITPFSDNTVGHTGAGFQDNFGSGHNVSGRYALYQNGTKIKSGKAPESFFGDLFVRAAISSKPAQIKFVMTASRRGKAPNPSAASRDVWTWPSRPDPTATVPARWYCGSKVVNHKIVPDRHCAIQDMMTLRYAVAGLSLHGTTAAGRQALGITVSHLPLGPAAKITHATLQVSYDKGSTWHNATLIRTGASQFHGSYTAPADTGVSLRVTARDAGGATVTETIMGAYQTAS
jgi:hypothetical protein